MKRLLIYLSCFLVVGGGGTLFQSCEALEVPGKKALTVTEGLVAYLPFTICHGLLKDSITKNETRKRNDAVWWNNTTPTFIEGFTGAKGGAKSAISFNGTTDYLKLLDNPTLQFNSDFSISLWISPDVDKFAPNNGTTNNDKVDVMQIFHKSVYKFPSDYESYSALIRLANIFYTPNPVKDSPTQTQFLVRSNIKMENTTSVCAGGTGDRGWQTAQFIVNPSVLGKNTWHHIVFTYNQFISTAYLDGNLLDNHTLGGTKIQSCSGVDVHADLRFGVQVEPYPQYFKGAMDEIRIYNRKLSDGEVRALFELKTI